MPIHTAEMGQMGQVLVRMEVVWRTNNSGLDPNVEPDEKKWLTGIPAMDYYITIFCENIAVTYKSKADSVDTKRHLKRHVNTW